MSNKLTLSKFVGGRFVPVGELDFGTPGKPVLKVKDDGPTGVDLRAAWTEVGAMPVIRMKWSEIDPKDPSGATQLLKGRDVRQDDPEYSQAVADILSRQFGFFGTPSEVS